MRRPLRSSDQLAPVQRVPAHRRRSCVRVPVRCRLSHSRCGGRRWSGRRWFAWRGRGVLGRRRAFPAASNTGVVPVNLCGTDRGQDGPDSSLTFGLLPVFAAWPALSTLDCAESLAARAWVFAAVSVRSAAPASTASVAPLPNRPPTASNALGASLPRSLPPTPPNAPPAAPTTPPI